MFSMFSLKIEYKKLIAICVGIFAYLLFWIPQQYDKPPLQPANGFASTGWEHLESVFKELIESGKLNGGAYSVYHRGKPVFSMAGGYADVRARVRWEPHTIGQFFSTTKGVGALVIAQLVQRNLLQYKDPIVKYWKEFGANGKMNISVEDLLSHKAGLAVIDKPFSIQQTFDEPEIINEILSSQTPNWTPGQKHGYHALSFGLYLEEFIKRVDPQRRPLSQYFRDEFAKKLDLDFYIGLPLEENYRCARFYGDINIKEILKLLSSRYRNFAINVLNSETMSAKAFANPVEFNVFKGGTRFNHPLMRRFRNVAVSGFASADSMAKLYGSVVDSKNVNGFYFNKSLIGLLTEELANGIDEILKIDITYGRGHYLRVTPSGGVMFGTPGHGGQMGYADPGNELGWAFLTNFGNIYGVGDDPRYLTLEKAMYDCVKNLNKT